MVRLNIICFNAWKPYFSHGCSLVERSVFGCSNITCLKYGQCYYKMCSRIKYGIVEDEEKKFFEKVIKNLHSQDVKINDQTVFRKKL